MRTLKNLTLAVCVTMGVVTSTSAGKRTLTPDGKHLFILSGQSNMRNPLPSTFTSLVKETFGEDKVLAVHYNRNGQPIREWYKAWKLPENAAKKDNGKPTGAVYNTLMKKVNKAIEGQSLASVSLIWMQGEADGQHEWGSVYETSFLGLLEQFKADLGIDHIYFVTGRINDYWVPPTCRDGNLVRDIQKKLGDSHTNGDWVNTDDLNRGINPWNQYSLNDGHFPNPGYVVMGQRFARKAITLIAPEKTVDEGLFKERFIDTSDDFDTHAAVEKTVKGTSPNAGATNLELLTNGKYGSTDPNDGSWVGFGDGATTVELTVDLGEVVVIKQAAVNILLNNDASATVPDKLTFSVSEDGKTFTPFCKGDIIFFTNRGNRRTLIIETIKAQSLLALAEAGKAQTKARYVKVRMEKNKGRIFVDEIVINPK